LAFFVLTKISYIQVTDKPSPMYTPANKLYLNRKNTWEATSQADHLKFFKRWPRLQKVVVSLF